MVIRYKKLIFVDTNDNCRAPMAEMILKRKFLTNPLTIESRGMVVLFPEPLNPKAEAVLTSNGYPQIWETYENAPHVYTVKEYVGESGDIPSLHGQPLTVYSQCYTELELLMRKLVTRLNEEEEL